MLIYIFAQFDKFFLFKIVNYIVNKLISTWQFARDFYCQLFLSFFLPFFSFLSFLNTLDFYYQLSLPLCLTLSFSVYVYLSLLNWFADANVLSCWILAFYIVRFQNLHFQGPIYLRNSVPGWTFSLARILNFETLYQSLI